MLRTLCTFYWLATSGLRHIRNKSMRTWAHALIYVTPKTNAKSRVNYAVAWGRIALIPPTIKRLYASIAPKRVHHENRNDTLLYGTRCGIILWNHCGFFWPFTKAALSCPWRPPKILLSTSGTAAAIATRAFHETDEQEAGEDRLPESSCVSITGPHVGYPKSVAWVRSTSITNEKPLGTYNWGKTRRKCR